MRKNKGCRNFTLRGRDIGYGNAYQEQEEKLCFRDISMNLHTGTVLVCGQELRLGAKEREILRVFLKDPEKFFSKANLYESVWGERISLVIIAGLVWLAVFYALAVWLFRTFEPRGNDDD